MALPVRYLHFQKLNQLSISKRAIPLPLREAFRFDIDDWLFHLRTSAKVATTRQDHEHHVAKLKAAQYPQLSGRLKKKTRHQCAARHQNARRPMSGQLLERQELWTTAQEQDFQNLRAVQRIVRLDRQTKLGPLDNRLSAVPRLRSLHRQR